MQDSQVRVVQTRLVRVSDVIRQGCVGPSTVEGLDHSEGVAVVRETLPLSHGVVVLMLGSHAHAHNMNAVYGHKRQFMKRRTSAVHARVRCEG